MTVRAAAGLQPADELILWGLLGATLRRQDAEPVLLATPYWMLRHLGLDTGGSQYVELRESLLRLALTSYQNTAFYNPETGEREYVAFQFLSMSRISSSPNVSCQESTMLRRSMSAPRSRTTRRASSGVAGRADPPSLVIVW